MDAISYLEILDRAKTGLQVGKSDWDMEHIVLPVRELVKKHYLQWDKTNAIPQDDALIDRLFQAGMEFAENSGIYCITTGRVIKFSGDELEAGTAGHAAGTNHGKRR